MDTIAAIATPTGAGAIGVIRLSGPRAFEVCSRLAALPDPVPSHHALLRTLRRDGDVLDQALVLPFVGPHSFTGEDVVELHCHGGTVTLRRVLDAVLAEGCRPAEPGEFSRRALLNGKLDLVQVEAIADVIHAESEAAHRLAQSHLAGRLSEQINDAKAGLFELMTLVEAAIDFSLEEHVYTISGPQIMERLDPILAGLESLLATYDAGRLRHDGVKVAIVGRPNAGKSTLLNLLLGEERAIVTDIPGTTRDTIEESVELGGVRFHLIDTAGLRETTDTVEALGVERTRRAAEAADVVVWVVDATLDAEAWGALHVGSGADVDSGARRQPVLLLRNKVDLLPASPAEFTGPEGVTETLSVSLAAGAGAEAITAALQRAAVAAGLEPGTESVLLSRARHRDLLEESVSSLQRARGAAECDLGHELIAFDLSAGMGSLGALTGAVTSDDVLARIFGDFCIGK